MPQALINVHSFLQDFNPSKFVVYSSLLSFSILFSLKLDSRINFQYWLIFSPLWVWHLIAFLGAFVGIIIWFRNANYRVSHSSYVHFKSMLISVSLQILLLMFEILACDKLETRRHTWTLTFVPLIFISLLSISVCVWSFKNGRSVELEFFAAVNILQIILIALKLDNLINWTWTVVFVPSWILLCFVIMIILYAMIFAAIVLRSAEVETDQRRASIHSASSSSMIFLPVAMFIILLTSKLDSPPNVTTPSYFATCLPLFLTFIILIRMSFGSKTGSLWWFGMRTDFCTYLLTIFPCLKEYGNTSFIINTHFGDTVTDSSSNQDNTATSVNVIVGTSSPPRPADSNPRIQDDVENATGNDTGSHGSKRFLQSLSRVLFRTKSRSCGGKELPYGSVISKYNIDIPD